MTDDVPALNEAYSEDQIEDAVAKIEERSRIDAQKQANSILKKNKREIKRLNELAQGAVLEDKYATYSYAIKKLRAIYRQPTTDELVAQLYVSSRHQIWKIINDNSGKI